MREGISHSHFWSREIFEISSSGKKNIIDRFMKTSRVVLIKKEIIFSPSSSSFVDPAGSRRERLVSVLLCS